MPQWPYRITKVSFDGASRCLIVIWSTGEMTKKAVSTLGGAGSAFEVLDTDDVWTEVTITQDGRALSWQGGLSLCADALWFEAHPEDNHFLARPAAAE